MSQAISNIIDGTVGIQTAVDLFKAPYTNIHCRITKFRLKQANVLDSSEDGNQQMYEDALLYWLITWKINCVRFLSLSNIGFVLLQ
jgi:hypothetical protein